MMTLRFFPVFLLGWQILCAQEVHVRTNLVGYSPQETKIALIMSNQPIEDQVEIVKWPSGTLVYANQAEEASGK